MARHQKEAPFLLNLRDILGWAFPMTEQPNAMPYHMQILGSRGCCSAGAAGSTEPIQNPFAIE